MRTSKTSNKSEKTSKDVGSVKRKKATIGNSTPSEEDIREKATEIYHQRIERGEQGTPENDWFEAENYLRETVV
jgi:hypothetical protein